MSNSLSHNHLSGEFINYLIHNFFSQENRQQEVGYTHILIFRNLLYMLVCQIVIIRKVPSSAVNVDAINVVKKLYLSHFLSYTKDMQRVT